MIMPRRPKQHQVEDQSIIALKKSLPREWVYREKDRDYGIDGEVEVFNENGYATGLIFLVQLKATDSTNHSRQRRVQLSNTAINYYKSLELPVLIIRYVDDNKTIYYRWVYEIDRYGSDEESETFSFVMKDDEIWTEETPRKLERKLLTIRSFKNYDNVLPINTYLNLTFTTFENITASKLKSSFRSILAEHKKQIEIVSSEEEASMIINISQDTIFVNLLGITGCYLHCELNNIYTKIDELVSDIFVAITVAFISANKPINGIAIFETFVEEAPSLKLPNVVMPIISELILLNKTSKIFELWKNIPEEYKDDILVIRFQSMMLHSKSDVSKEYEHFLIVRINENKELDNKTSLGVAHYNYANFLHNRRRDREALAQYRKALKFNPHYHQEDYIHKEIAGALFHLKRYCFSAKCYRIGIDKKHDLKSVVLYADALMMSGEYLLARRAFRKYFRTSGLIESEWCLKDMVLDYIMNVLGIRSQHRMRSEANKHHAFKKDLATLTQEEMVEVLYIDALSPLAWFNLGLLFYHKADFNNAMLGFIISGLMNQQDTEAWINALKALIQAPKQYYLLITMIECAYERCGEEFIRLLHDFIDEMSQDGVMDEFQKIATAVDEIIDELHKKKDEKNPTFRIFNKISSTKLYF
jgi:tetratricopeptide (TPR) repeat protein